MAKIFIKEVDQSKQSIKILTQIQYIYISQYIWISISFDLSSIFYDSLTMPSIYYSGSYMLYLRFLNSLTCNFKFVSSYHCNSNKVDLSGAFFTLPILSILKLNLKRAPEMWTIFGSQWIHRYKTPNQSKWHSRDIYLLLKLKYFGYIQRYPLTIVGSIA